jgi:hypothetical protein
MNFPHRTTTRQRATAAALAYQIRLIPAVQFIRIDAYGRWHMNRAKSLIKPLRASGNKRLTEWHQTQYQSAGLTLLIRVLDCSSLFFRMSVAVGG